MSPTGNDRHRSTQNEQQKLIGTGLNTSAVHRLTYSAKHLAFKLFISIFCIIFAIPQTTQAQLCLLIEPQSLNGSKLQHRQALSSFK